MILVSAWLRFVRMLCLHSAVHALPALCCACRDCVRVAGPGVYVGCSYPVGAQGQVLKDKCVYFMLVRAA